MNTILHVYHIYAVADFAKQIYLYLSNLTESEDRHGIQYGAITC